MNPDPILSELWEIKDGLAAECGHDLRRLFDLLQAMQDTPAGRVVDPTRVRATATADT